MSDMDPAAREQHQQKLQELSTPADVEHWGKADYWLLDEFVALSFDLEPRKVDWSKIQPLIERTSLAREYRDRRGLVLRASELFELSNRTTPAAFLKWAVEHDITCPQNLIEQVEKYSVSAEPETNVAAVMAERDEALEEIERLQAHKKKLEAKLKDPSPKERETLQKMILGMALKTYQYKPGASRNQTSQHIRKALAFYEITLDEKTIRDALRKAADNVDYFPPDTEK